MKHTGKSVILISTGTETGKLSIQTKQSELYAQCLEEFDAAGVLDGGFGSAQELAERMDALILSGGGDIHPKCFGQRMNKHVRNVNVARDEREFDLLRCFCEQKKPVLGICRGIQLIDVFFGGTLFAHLGNADLHEDTKHIIITSEYGSLRPILGKQLCVNSYHHQAIRTLGKGLSVTAMSKADGVIEGIEHETLPIIAVQWHMERMMEGICQDTDCSMHPIWEQFIQMTHRQPAMV